MIYQEGRTLTDYQQRINDASYSLCLANPALLLGKKGDIYDLARAKVHEDGYNYKKGRSRSKKHQTVVEGDEPAVKRVKINAEERQRQISELTEEISELSRRITFKERRIEDATLSRNYRACDDLAAEVSELKARRKELNAELAKFQQKAKKAKNYIKRKQTPTTSTDNAPLGDTNAEGDPEVEVIGEGESKSF